MAELLLQNLETDPSPVRASISDIQSTILTPNAANAKKNEEKKDTISSSILIP